MPILKFCVTFTLLICGWVNYIKAFIAYKKDETDEVVLSIKKSFCFFIPTIILGKMGWNLNNALKRP